MTFGVKPKGAAVCARLPAVLLTSSDLLSRDFDRCIITLASLCCVLNLETRNRLGEQTTAAPSTRSSRQRCSLVCVEHINCASEENIIFYRSMDKILLRNVKITKIFGMACTD